MNTTVSNYPLALHQREAFQRLYDLGGRGGLFLTMGGGKTRVALSYAHSRGCTRILVVLPLSVTSVWEREAALIDFPMEVIDLTLEDSVKDRAARLKRATSAVVLVNYESYWREPLRSAITRWGPDAVLLDEIHRIRHRGSRQARFAHILATKPTVRVALGLTGTPVTNGLQDAWSIFRFISPDVFGRWPDFQNRFLIMGGYKGYQIVGYMNVAEARQKIADRSFQWEGQMFSTPPDVPVMVRLSRETRAVYDELRKRAIVEITNAAGESRTVLAGIVLTLLLRLQQITCGFVRDVGEELIEVGEEKANATLDLISDAVAQKQQVVVFARFLHDLDLLERKMPTGIKAGRIDGSRSPLQRKEALARFEAGQYDVMLCQIKAASLGIDLSSASVGIFYSVGFSLDEFLQAKGRLSGALRQKHDVVFYHILCARTVDEKVYTALTDKTAIARRVTDLTYALNLLGGP
jgi:SNF2 family DNA or RNA helicase